MPPPPSSPTPSLRRYQTLTLALLFAAGAVNFFDRASLTVANTTISADLHLSSTEMGWLLSAFSLAYGLSQLPLIALLARSGTRAVLGTGLTLWSTAQLLTSLVRGLPSFLALRVLLGIGESPFYPAGVHAVRDWFSDRSRARATAVMSSSQTLGLALAPPVLTLLMLHLGWRAMFALLGIAGLLVALSWSLLYRARAHTPFADPASPTAPPTAAAGFQSLLRRRTVWGMMLGFGGINYTNWLYTSWIPAYLHIARHLSLARTGWVAAVPFLAGAAGMFSSGLLTDSLARHHPLSRVHRGCLVSGMVLSAASTAVVAQSTSTLTAVAGISFALFFIHFAGTSGWGYAQLIGAPTDQVAPLSALQNFSSFLIASAAPVLTGFLLDRTHSFTTALFLCAAVTLLGALSYATLAAPDTYNVQRTT